MTNRNYVYAAEFPFRISRARPRTHLSIYFMHLCDLSISCGGCCVCPLPHSHPFRSRSRPAFVNDWVWVTRKANRQHKIPYFMILHNEYCRDGVARSRPNCRISLRNLSGWFDCALPSSHFRETLLMPAAARMDGRRQIQLIKTRLKPE